jgi:CMP-N,N'-diacetyllegionaminic acid synthase
MAYQGKKIVAIIPARAGSKRVVNKNIRKLGGKSLVERAMELASSLNDLIDKVVLSSDGELLLEEARRFPNVVALKRPDAISGDKAPAITYVQHALQEVEKLGDHYDIVVILQPSSPFTLPEDVQSTIEKLDFDNGIEASVSVMECDHAYHPMKLKRLVGATLQSYLEDENGKTAAHEIPMLYVRNGSVYVASRKLIDQGIIISDKSNAHIMPRERSIDINDELDFSFAEFMFTKMKNENVG